MLAGYPLGRENRINRIGVAGLIASFVLLIVAFAFVISGFAASQRASELVVHTYDVKDIVSEVGGDLERAEAARRGYLLDPAPYRLRVYQESAGRLIPAIDQVRFRTADNPGPARARGPPEAPARGAVVRMGRSIEMVRSGRAEEARRQFDIADDREKIAEVRALADELEEREEALLTERLAEAGERSAGPSGC